MSNRRTFSAEALRQLHKNRPKLPIGTEVMIALDNRYDLPGGWVEQVQPMETIGVIVRYADYGSPHGVRIDFPRFSDFYTEDWCLVEVPQDNERLVGKLRDLPEELVELGTDVRY